MKSRIQGLLCAAGVHDFQFIGADGADRVYRCTCGQRKVEAYTLRVDRIGLSGKGAGGPARKFVLMGRKKSC